MRVTTEYHEVGGEGRMTARGSIYGRKRQVTVAYDHSKTPAHNHGSVAGEWLRRYSGMSVEKLLSLGWTAQQISPVKAVYQANL